MVRPTAFRDRIERLYEDFFADPLFREFVGNSGYANYGLWDDTTDSGRAACDRMVDHLIAPIEAGDGRVLDVACGQGGTTERLGHHFSPDRVVAINLATSQLRATGERAPDAQRARMDAAALGFADRTFDAVVCIEAAFHFETREDFLREAFRVLRPGGTLALADIIARSRAGRIPHANMVRDLDEYRAVLERTGFVDVRLEDRTTETWDRFRREYASFAWARANVSQAVRSVPKIPWLLWRYLVTQRAIQSYFLGWARVPD